MLDVLRWVALYGLALNGLLRLIGVPSDVGLWHIVTRKWPQAGSSS